MLTLGVVDEASATVLGLDGRRPRRPLRLSVRTTKKWAEKRRGTLKANVSDTTVAASHNLKNNYQYQFQFPFSCSWHYKALVSYVCHS